MSSDEIIPRKNEFLFLLKFIFIIITSLLVSSLVLFVFLNKNLGDSYPSAFQIIADAFNKMNLIIIIAVLLQLCLSSILLFFVALLFSHKIAGPMFRLKRILKEHIDGEKQDKISFRRTDFLPGVSIWFSKFFSILRKRERLLEEAEILMREIETKKGKDNMAKIKRVKDVVIELDNEDVL